MVQLQAQQLAWYQVAARYDVVLTPADDGFTFRVGQRHTPALAGVV